jgi:hypothetical protein
MHQRSHQSPDVGRLRADARKLPPGRGKESRLFGPPRQALPPKHCEDSGDAAAEAVRRESPAGNRRPPDVAGREWAADTYNPTGLGRTSSYTDGIWDMRMVPSDPPGNVLANTGEIGQEK